MLRKLVIISLFVGLCFAQSGDEDEIYDPDPKLTYAVNRYGDVDSVMRYFEPGWSNAKITEATKNRDGKWTVFLDADKPWGTGEFENNWRARLYYMDDCRALWCRNPVAMDVALSDDVLNWNQNATIDKAYRCSNYGSKITPKRGYHCMNMNQKASRFPNRDPECTEYICKESGMYSSCRRCFNAKVRYFCLYEDMSCRHNTFPFLI